MGRCDREFACESIGQFFVNLETALIDCRSEGCLNPVARRTRRNHRIDRFLDDAGDYPAPSRMDGARDPRMAIDHQNRNTISREYSQHHAWLRGDHRVAFKDRFPEIARHPMHDVAVHLTNARDAEILSECGTRCVPVRSNSTWVIADRVREVQLRKGSGAHAATTAKEACSYAFEIPRDDGRRRRNRARVERCVHRRCSSLEGYPILLIFGICLLGVL